MFLWVVAVAVISTVISASAVGNEPVPPPWLTEAMEHPPSVPPAPASTPGGEDTTGDDTIPPDTSIDQVTLRPRLRSAKFAFRSSEEESSFWCKLDRRRAFRCGSPQVFNNLSPGRHVLGVAAVDASENPDASPAAVRFKLKRSSVAARSQMSVGRDTRPSL
ncbi:MAG: hypothetical protein WA687_04625 [Solirubrobacterales bacterium]